MYTHFNQVLKMTALHYTLRKTKTALTFLRNIQVLDFIISTGTCIYDTLEGFQRRGTQKIQHHNFRPINSNL